MLRTGAKRSHYWLYISLTFTKFYALQETDLAAIDLSTPLGDDEKIPTKQWYHRETPSSKLADTKKKSGKKSTKHKVSVRGEDKSKTKKESPSKRSKSKKSPRKEDEMLIQDISEEKQESGVVEEYRHHYRSKKSSSQKKSGSGKKSGDREKSKKRRDRHDSSERQEAPVVEEPLLLF